jgi:flagellar basal-body rod protein FlgF
MNVGMYRGVKAMEASERRLAAITSNLANMRSTAYKRVAAVQHGEATNSTQNDRSGVETNLSIDWTQGPLERTGVSTDLALTGGGFFTVEGPEGELYTRDGQFQVTEAGDLVTQDGLPVAWDGGRGTIDPIGEALVISLDGSVNQGSQNLGKLKLVDFEAREKLDQERHGYFVASPALKQIPADAEVHQFSLEGANVSSVEELVRLIETQRAFEAGSRVVQLIGETYQRLASSARR